MEDKNEPQRGTNYLSAKTAGGCTERKLKVLNKFMVENGVWLMVSLELDQ